MCLLTPHARAWGVVDTCCVLEGIAAAKKAVAEQTRALKGSCAVVGRSLSDALCRDTEMDRRLLVCSIVKRSRYLRFPVNVPSPRSPAESLPFIESLFSTVPSNFSSTFIP